MEEDRCQCSHIDCAAGHGGMQCEQELRRGSDRLIRDLTVAGAPFCPVCTRWRSGVREQNNKEVICRCWSFRFGGCPACQLRPWFSQGVGDDKALRGASFPFHEHHSCGRERLQGRPFCAPCLLVQLEEFFLNLGMDHVLIRNDMDDLARELPSRELQEIGNVHKPRQVWTAEQSWAAVHVGNSPKRLETYFPNLVFARLTLLGERAVSMPVEKLPDFISKGLPDDWAVREARPLPWIYLSVGDCLDEARKLYKPEDLSLLRKIQFVDVDPADYDRAPHEMMPLRCGVGRVYLVAGERRDTSRRAFLLRVSASGAHLEKICPHRCPAFELRDGVRIRFNASASGLTVSHKIAEREFSRCLSDRVPIVSVSGDHDLIATRCVWEGFEFEHVAGSLSMGFNLSISTLFDDMQKQVERDARSFGVSVAWVPPALSTLIQDVLKEKPSCIRAIDMNESNGRAVGDRRDAFHKLLLSYLGKFVAEDKTPSNVRDCMFVCLRETCGTSLWTIRSLAEVWLLSKAQSPMSRLLRPPEPRDFAYFGELLGMAYRGPSLQTSGLDGIGTFQSTPTCLPQMPWEKTVLERPTEWAYAEREGSGDVIEASVSNLFVNIVIILFDNDFLNISENICDLVSMLTYWVSAQTLLMNILRQREDGVHLRRDLDKDASTLRGVVLYQDSFGLACLEHFRTSDTSALRRRREFAVTNCMFAQAASRRIYDDYVTIGRLSGGEYCGCLPGRVDDSAAITLSQEVLAKVQPDGYPPTVWLSSAVFRKSKAGDDRESDYHVTSFYGLHRQIQRQQPTFASLLAAIRSIEKQGQSVSLESLGPYFPSVPAPLLQQLWEMDVEAQTACKQNETFLNELYGDTCERRPVRVRRRVRGKNPRSLTEQSLLLREENRRFEVDELNRLYPCFDRSKSRVLEPLSRQPLGPKARFGLEVGGRRGMSCLHNDYCDLLIRKDKDLRKLGANDQSSPGMSMDVDLERRNEALPLSPWLLEKMKGLSQSARNGSGVTEESRPPSIMACLNDPKYQHDLLERIRSASAALEHVVELERNCDDLETVNDAQEELTATSSRHEICIGFAHMYLTSLEDTRAMDANQIRFR